METDTTTDLRSSAPMKPQEDELSQTTRTSTTSDQEEQLSLRGRFRLTERRIDQHLTSFYQGLGSPPSPTNMTSLSASSSEDDFSFRSEDDDSAKHQEYYLLDLRRELEQASQDFTVSTPVDHIDIPGEGETVKQQEMQEMDETTTVCSSTTSLVTYGEKDEEPNKEEYLQSQETMNTSKTTEQSESSCVPAEVLIKFELSEDVFQVTPHLGDVDSVAFEQDEEITMKDVGMVRSTDKIERKSRSMVWYLMVVTFLVAILTSALAVSGLGGVLVHEEEEDHKTVQVVQTETVLAVDVQEMSMEEDVDEVDMPQATTTAPEPVPVEHKRFKRNSRMLVVDRRNQGPNVEEQEEELEDHDLTTDEEEVVQVGILESSIETGPQRRWTCKVLGRHRCPSWGGRDRVN